MSRHISGDNTVVVETRRRWTDEERREAVNATRTEPVCVVARQRGIARSLLFRWRKEAGLSGGRRREKKRAPAFVPVVLPVAEKPPRGAPAQGPDGGLIEIVLAGGCRVRLSGGVDLEALKRVIAVLEGR